MMRHWKVFLPILLAGLVLLLTFLAGRLPWHEAQSDTKAREEGVVVTRLPLSACDLSQTSCRIELPDGGVLIAELTPRPLALLQPLTARLLLQDIPAQSAWLSLSGVSMNMPPFDPVSLQETLPGQFIGQAALPICVNGRMRWRAEFRITHQDRQLIAEFQFDSQ
jgi:hypothetical protein